MEPLYEVNLSTVDAAIISLSFAAAHQLGIAPNSVSEDGLIKQMENLNPSGGSILLTKDEFITMCYGVLLAFRLGVRYEALGLSEANVNDLLARLDEIAIRVLDDIRGEEVSD